MSSYNIHDDLIRFEGHASTCINKTVSVQQSTSESDSLLGFDTVNVHNITAKAALIFGSDAWVLKRKEEQRLEAAQMKFLGHLIGITKLDKEKNQNKTREPVTAMKPTTIFAHKLFYIPHIYTLTTVTYSSRSITIYNYFRPKNCSFLRRTSRVHHAVITDF
jgi:hypothetical protein